MVAFAHVLIVVRGPSLSLSVSAVIARYVLYDRAYAGFEGSGTCMWFGVLRTGRARGRALENWGMGTRWATAWLDLDGSIGSADERLGDVEMEVRGCRQPWRMCIPSVDTTCSRDGRAIELQQLHSLRCQPWFERSSLHLRL